MSTRRLILDHDFYCTCCGRKGIPISRKMNKIKETGHLKKLYCIYCNREVNHAEVVENSQYNKEAFLDEYRSGNFDREGNRVIPLKEWRILFYGLFTPDTEEMEEELDVDEWLKIFEESA
jgi:hypothetical protein